MSKYLPNRRKRETLTLAVISLVCVCALRWRVEPWLLFGSEVLIILVGLAGTLWAQRNRKIQLATGCGVLLMSGPIVMAFVTRWVSYPIGFEITTLTFLGSAALMLASINGKMQSISIVLSGFLTLFATVISDHPYSVGIAILWMTVCVWHLVANHWERIDLCSVENVSRSWSVRPASVISAIGLVLIAGVLTRGWFGESTRLTGGFMPFSGGSSWSDPGARDGIGTGDAAIAAKDNADSFGAVDSEIFLETTQSTLFDMFSDAIGKPKLKQKWERRQGMTQERVIDSHGRTAKSQKGGNSFTMEREPPKEHLHLHDVTEDAVIQWSGPTGIRLAMNRYDTFDGQAWTNQALHRDEKLATREFGEDFWFFDNRIVTKALAAKPEQVARGMIKNLCLNTTRLPTPMLTAGLHIKDVNRQDFFGIDDDGSYFMPGREKVPPLTIIHTASLKLTEDDLIERLAVDRSNQSLIASPQRGQETASKQLAQLAHQWSAGQTNRYDKMRAIVDHFRSEFEFDRSVDLDSDRPLDQFLSEKRGGDHWFAAAMALMAREIGLQSRLVTGFYVRPSAVDVAASHSNVRADDVHVWTEIRLANGVWFEVEPTPGFKQPIYHPSFWLVSRRWLQRNWPHVVLAMVLLGAIYFTRLFWCELALSSLWWLSAPLTPYRRLVLAIRIVELRAWLVGRSRPASSPTRQWLLEDLAATDPSAGFTAGASHTDARQRQAAESYCDLADRLCFGPANQQTTPRGEQVHVIGNLVASFPMRKMKPLLKESQHVDPC